MKCPDSELISAWLDGEIPSPWSETIEKHINECSSCNAKRKNLESVGLLFKMDNNGIEEQENRAKEKVFEKLSSSNPVFRKQNIWSQRYNIPFPLVAAAVLVFAVMAFSLISLNSRNSELQMAMTKTIESVPGSANGLGMDSILELISNQGSGVNININLPAEAFSGSTSNPVFVRESSLLQKVNW